MKVVVMTVFFLLGGFSTIVFAMDNLPMKGREGLSLAAGVGSTDFSFSSERVRTSFATKFMTAFAGTRYDLDNVGIGLDVGLVNTGVEDAFVDGGDFSSNALYLRPTVSCAKDLNEMFKIGGSFSYEFFSGSDEEKAKSFLSWQGIERLSIGKTHVFKLVAPMVQMQMKDTALYAGFTSQYVRMSPTRVWFSSPLNGWKEFELDISHSDSYGFTFGAVTNVIKSVALGIQGQSMTKNGSGVQGELIVGF